MNKNKKALLISIAIASVLFLAAFLQFGTLLSVLLPKHEHITYATSRFGSQFRIGLSFSLMLSLAPILLYFTWQRSGIQSIRKRSLSIVFLLVSMAISLLIRRQLLLTSLQEVSLVKSSTAENITISIPLENVHFEWYLLAGLIVGALLSSILLKEKKTEPNVPL